MNSVDVIKRDLKKILSEYRYLHCLRVADLSRELAHIYHVDVYKAYLAGLVHDIAKEFSVDDNKNIIYKYNLPIELLNRDYSKILHSDIGACIARYKYELSEDICHAVLSHTIGDIPMNTLDKIVFVADKIEPFKNYEGIDEEREMAYHDIHEATIMCISNNHKKLMKQHKRIYPKSMEVLKYLKENKE